MQEDIAGLQSQGGNRYATCTQCGRVFLRRVIRAQESGLRQGVRSNYAEICLDCERLIRRGEVPPGGIGDDP